MGHDVEVEPVVAVATPELSSQCLDVVAACCEAQRKVGCIPQSLLGLSQASGFGPLDQAGLDEAIAEGLLVRDGKGRFAFPPPFEEEAELPQPKGTVQLFSGPVPALGETSATPPLATLDLASSDYDSSVAAWRNALLRANGAEPDEDDDEEVFVPFFEDAAVLSVSVEAQNILLRMREACDHCGRGPCGTQTLLAHIHIPKYPHHEIADLVHAGLLHAYKSDGELFYEIEGYARGGTDIDEPSLYPDPEYCEDVQ